MSERGVFAVDRGIWSDPDFPNEPFSEREAFLWLVSEAAWRPTKVRVGSKLIELDRGQCSFSTRFMAAKFQWSEARVRRFLQRRSDMNQLRTKTDAGATQVTICKYDAFQRVGTVSDASATQERRTSDAKKKQGNKETDPSEPIGSSGAPERDDEQAAFDAWNEMASRTGLSQAEKLGKDRRSKLKARIADVGGLEGWRKAMARLEASDFCAGRKTDFRADLDFVLQPRSFTKLIEGSYDNNPNQRGQHEQRHSHPQRGAAAVVGYLDNIVARNELRDAPQPDREGPGWSPDGVQGRELSVYRGDGGSQGFDRGGPLRAVAGRDFR